MESRVPCVKVFDVIQDQDMESRVPFVEGVNDIQEENIEKPNASTDNVHLPQAGSSQGDGGMCGKSQNLHFARQFPLLSCPSHLDIAHNSSAHIQALKNDMSAPPWT